MKVLVTGGGGFLGSAVCRKLRQLDHEVISFQRGPAAHLLPLGVQVAQGDICDRQALRDASADCEAIVHTAAKAGIWGSLEDYQRINSAGTQNVIQVCRDLAIPILVHTSSPSVTHCNRDIEGADETLPVATHFLAPYPATKAAAEQDVLAANSSALKTTALRPHLIWGPGDPHLLPRLAARVRRGRLFLPGAAKRIDTVFVDNAAQAHVDALLELRAGARNAGKAYFISNGEPLPQGEIIARLLDAIGIPVRIVAIPAAAARWGGKLCEFGWKLFRLASEPPLTRFSAEQLTTAHWYDISAARRDLDFVPRISVSEGLAMLRQSLAQNACPEPRCQP